MVFAMNPQRNPACVTNPDGTDMVATTRNSADKPSYESNGNPASFAPVDDAFSNPYQEFDAIASAELNRMKQDDALYDKLRTSIDQVWPFLDDGLLEVLSL